MLKDSYMWIRWYGYCSQFLTFWIVMYNLKWRTVCFTHSALVYQDVSLFLKTNSIYLLSLLGWRRINYYRLSQLQFTKIILVLFNLSIEVFNRGMVHFVWHYYLSHDMHRVPLNRKMANRQTKRRGKMEKDVDKS